MIKIKLKMITRGAMAIALIFVSFTLFKGVTNILNAFLVPLTLYLCTINQKKMQVFSLYFAVVILCSIFFNMQIFFIVFYCCIAFLLLKLREKNINTILSALALTITISFCFWIGIMLTDLIFLTQMNYIIMDALKGKIYIYGMTIIIEGALVGVGQLFISKMVVKRISRTGVKYD